MRHAPKASSGWMLVFISVLTAACTNSPILSVSPEPSPLASPVPSPLPSATAAPSPTATSPAATQPPPSAEPSRPEASAGAFRFGDVLALTVDGLAVREGPSVDSPRLHGYQVVGVSTATDLGEVRLGLGDFVSVEIGPLPVGDMTWYLVRPAQGGELGFSTVSWRPAGVDGGSSPGWIASATGERQHAALHRRPNPAEIVGGDGPMMAGTGDWVSEPQPRHDLFRLQWAVAATVSPCRLIIQLVPESGSPSFTAVDAVTSGVVQGALTGPSQVIEPPWGERTEGDWDSYVVSVRSSCPWSVGLWRLEHD
jgi:hypothetical protein